ncbi:MAG: amidohydrolase family protein [Hyphomicrobiaceae bacterium]
MSIFDEPKFDCHNHILDPLRFPYGTDSSYRPAGQEVATFDQFGQVMTTYGVRRALIVSPNSGYGTDNRCLLDAIARSAGRCKGIAVVPLDCGTDELRRLKAQGIVGIAFNATFPQHSVAYYMGTRDLLARLADLELFLQIQVEGDMLAEMLPLIEATKVRLLIDHGGRPTIANGLAQPGFQALLVLGRSGRAAVKLSGWQKYSRLPGPHPDAMPFARALIDAFGPDACMWGSDWPFLKATERVDYGPLLTLAAALFPDPTIRRKIMWETPCRLFGFSPEF